MWLWGGSYRLVDEFLKRTQDREQTVSPCEKGEELVGGSVGAECKCPLVPTDAYLFPIPLACSKLPGCSRPAAALSFPPFPLPFPPVAALPERHTPTDNLKDFVLFPPSNFSDGQMREKRGEMMTIMITFIISRNSTAT